MIRVVTNAGQYPDVRTILMPLVQHGYEFLVGEGAIVLLCDTTDDPDSEEADLFLQELHLDVPGFVVDEVLA